jgi:hypothetical protein
MKERIPLVRVSVWPRRRSMRRPPQRAALATPTGTRMRALAVPLRMLPIALIESCYCRGSNRAPSAMAAAQRPPRDAAAAAFKVHARSLQYYTIVTVPCFLFEFIQIYFYRFSQKNQTKTGFFVLSFFTQVQRTVEILNRVTASVRPAQGLTHNCSKSQLLCLFIGSKSSADYTVAVTSLSRRASSSFYSNRIPLHRQS